MLREGCCFFVNDLLRSFARVEPSIVIIRTLAEKFGNTLSTTLYELHER